MKKIYVLDTSAIIADPDVITSLQDNEVLIPLVVIKELDTIKTEPNSERGQKARKAIRILDDLRQKGSLTAGVETPEGGLIKVSIHTPSPIGEGTLDNNKADVKIVATAVEAGGNIVSNDLALCTVANCFDVAAEGYKAKNVVFNHRRYAPIEIYLDATKIAELVSVGVQKYDFVYEGVEPLINQGVIVSRFDRSSSVLARYIGNNVLQYIDSKQFAQYREWIEPRNVEQKFALELLTNRKIQLVNLIGPAGGGKSFVTLAAGLLQVLEAFMGEEKPRYERLAITKSVVAFGGQDLGFLPGDKDEKMGPVVANLMSHLNNLLGREAEMFVTSGQILVEPLAYIRGKSLDNTFLVVDEAQNLSEEDLLTILTRAGNNTKIVLTGDPTQCDAPYLNTFNNGLMRVVKAFENQQIAGTGIFLESQRQELARLAAKLLGRNNDFWEER